MNEAQVPLAATKPPGVRPGLLLILGLSVVAAVYGQAIEGPFIWDDRLLIPTSPERHSGPDLLALLSSPFWSLTEGFRTQASYYRPLTALLFALDHVVHGGNPTGFHVTNLALHLLNTFLAQAVLVRLGLGRVSAVCAATAWALLPRSTEAAAWISGRGDVLATTFVLGALLAFDSLRKRRVALAALFLFLGLLAKESAFGGFTALLVWNYANSRWRAKPGDETASRRRLSVTSVILTLPVAAYAGLRLLAGALRADSLPLGVRGRVLAILEAIGRNLTMIANPFSPESLHGQVNASAPVYVATGAVALFALVGASIHRRRYRAFLDRDRFTLLALLLGSLGLVLHVIPLPLNVIAADRFLYLPSIAILGLLGHALAALGLGRKAPKGAALLAVGVIMALGARSHARVLDFTDEGRFWQQALHDAPTHPTASLELGGVYYRAALYDQALPLFERSLALNGPARSLAEYNTAACLGRVGRYAEARSLATRLLEATPTASHFLLAARLAVSDLDFIAADTLVQLALAQAAEDPELLELERKLPALKDDAARLAEERDPVLLARFHVRTGRHAEALANARKALDAELLSDTAGRDLLEYLVRFGTSSDVERIRQLAPPSQGDGALFTRAAEERLEELNPLLARWPDVQREP